jgi:hypothetical protein
MGPHDSRDSRNSMVEAPSEYVLLDVFVHIRRTATGKGQSQQRAIFFVAEGTN